MLITSARIELLAEIELHILGITEVGKIHQKCKLLKSKIAASAILILKKCYYFHALEFVEI